LETFQMQIQNPSRIIPEVVVGVLSRLEGILLVLVQGVEFQIKEELMLIIYDQLSTSYRVTQPQALNPYQERKVMCQRAW